MAHHRWLLSWSISEVCQSPPTCLSSAVDAQLPPSLLLKSAISGMSHKSVKKNNNIYIKFFTCFIVWQKFISHNTQLHKHIHK